MYSLTQKMSVMLSNAFIEGIFNYSYEKITLYNQRIVNLLSFLFFYFN